MVALPQRVCRSAALRFIVVGSFLIAGCGKKQIPNSIGHPVAQENTTETPISVPAEGQQVLPVKQGKPPLVYLVESATTLRIVDVTNSAEMLLLPVSGRTTVSLTENGLRVGGVLMKYPSLPADHVFAIYLVSNAAGQNMIRTSTVRPGQAPGAEQPNLPPTNVPLQPLLPTNPEHTTQGVQ